MKGSLALRWDVRSARLTTLRIGKPSAASWWELLHGVPAIKKTKRGAILEESGLIEGQNLLLADQHTRLDVVVTPGQVAMADFPNPSIGTLDAVNERMWQLALKLTALKQYPTAHRLAFGVTLFHTSFERSSTLETLAQVFPELSKELKKSTDFVFQISHPGRIPLGDNSLEIHSLQKWYFVQLRLDGGPQSEPVDAFSAIVDLDISTASSPDLRLSASDAAQILPRLIQGAKRVLEIST